MNVAVLKTGLFPDDTLNDGIDRLYLSCRVFLYDATRNDLADDDWDRALDEILAADRLIVL
ncbi:MAG: hypothetical protein C0631_16415 [Sedimenticola sp.]|jgi:hypothetical protein|nr:MAG: hypothetical protein C0631_16415 [Sedimenticola sp.]